MIVKFFKRIERVENILLDRLPMTFNLCYALFLVFQLTTFYFFGRITANYNLNWWTPQLWIDLSVPLILPMVVPYILYYPLILTPVFFPMNKMKEKIMAFGLASASVFNYILSFMISVHVNPRVPLFDQEQGVLLDILNWIYVNDPGGLYFPSLHVTHSLLIGFYLWERGSFKRLFLLVAFLVSVSTVFVKQHFILDSFMGIFTAIFIYYLTSHMARKVFKIKL